MGKLRNYFLNHYPRTDFHELNQDWMISMLYDMINQVENFVEINAVKYADPFEWDITRQYEKNTIVIVAETGVAYMSTKPVPRGINILRTEYWTSVFDLSRFLEGGLSNFAVNYERQFTYTATMPTDIGHWIVWDSKLYVALEDISIGDMYAPDINIRRTTVEQEIASFVQSLTTAINNEVSSRQDADNSLHTEIVNESVARENADADIYDAIDDEETARQNADTTLQNNINTEVTARINADNTLQNNIDTEVTARQQAINNAVQTINGTIGNLNALETIDKSNIVNAINEALNTSSLDIVTPQMFGAIGNGTHDDTQAIQTAINTGKRVYFPKGRYRTTSTLTVVQGTVLEGSMVPLASGNDWGACIIHDGAGDTIQIPNYTPCTIKNIMLDKINSTTGNGITVELCDGFIFDHVKVVNHSIGFSIKATSFSEVIACTAERNYGDGFYFGNNSTLNVCQVQVTRCLSELNDGIGFHYVSQNSTMPVGVFSNNMTFANTRGGVVYEGVNGGAPTGIHIEGCFIGSDGLSAGIYVGATTYPVLISNCYIEMIGLDKTGREYNTPASHFGKGIDIRAGQASISCCTFTNNSEAGVSFSTNGNSIVNCSFYGNGAHTSTLANLVAAGRCTITGCQFMSGTNGVYVATNLEVIINGNDFYTGAAVANANAETRIKNNAPWAVNN